MKKKVFMFLLSLTMCSSIIPQAPVFAKEIQEISNTIDKDLEVKKFFDENINHIEVALMRNILTDENIIIGDITISEPINIINTNTYVFPVLNDGNLIKFIELKNTSDGYFIRIGTLFADKINSLPKDEYVIYKNKKGDVIATNNKEQFLLSSFQNNINIEEFSNNQDFSKHLENNSINSKINNTIYDINEKEVKNIKYSIKDGSWNYQYPVIGQGRNNNYCWAACMASILQGLGMNYSMQDVINNSNKGNETSDSSEVLEFFKDYGVYGEKYFHPITKDFLEEEINNGRAIWQAMSTEDYSLGHAIVIYGYFDTYGQLYTSIIDPYDSGQRVDCNVVNGKISYEVKDWGFKDTYFSTEGIYNLK